MIIKLRKDAKNIQKWIIERNSLKIRISLGYKKIVLGGMLLLEERLGEIRKNKCGTNMKIVKYYGHSDITVKFMDQYEAEVDTIYSNFIRGQVKNPYDKTVYDIGYIGEGKYKAAIEKQLLEPRYSVWRNLLGRCYSPKVKNYKAYSDCIVCDEWHNYQNFAEWYDSNIYQVGTERMHLDKDILVKNNRLYSPDTCLMVMIFKVCKLIFS